MDGLLRELADIDKMQCEFMPERGAADAAFVLMRLTEKFQNQI